VTLATPGREPGSDGNEKRMTRILVSVVELNVNGSKICYQCDQKNPSSWWKFWGEKITRCNGIPFEKYATRTSKAFGSSVLTCYTVSCH